MDTIEHGLVLRAGALEMGSVPVSLSGGQSAEGVERGGQCIADVFDLLLGFQLCRPPFVIGLAHHPGELGGVPIALLDGLGAGMGLHDPGGREVLGHGVTMIHRLVVEIDGFAPILDGLKLQRHQRFWGIIEQHLSGQIDRLLIAGRGVLDGPGGDAVPGQAAGPVDRVLVVLGAVLQFGGGQHRLAQRHDRLLWVVGQ
ncbi:Uncharacterised protein [Mycobacteroides abscessus subsp. abscessus]|nr:Uncharacterised protein [Mycobacteroides abscessus subsp. abscessus]